MNSDVMKEFLTSESQAIQMAKAKIEMGEAKVVSEGHAIEAMLNSDGWKVLSKDLQLMEEGLNNKLRHGNNLTKSQMERYIDCINLTEQFRKSPAKFVIRMKMLINRKNKGVI